jgi:hypothetical protein
MTLVPNDLLRLYCRTNVCVRPTSVVHKSRTTRFRKVLPNIVSIITAALFLAFRNAYRFACTEKKAPENSKVNRSLQDCGFSVLD